MPLEPSDNDNQTRAVERLRRNPSDDHEPENYEDLQQQLEFSPLLYSSLERYLPSNLLNSNREVKAQYMREVLLRYSPADERKRARMAQSFSSCGFEPVNASPQSNQWKCTFSKTLSCHNNNNYNNIFLKKGNKEEKKTKATRDLSTAIMPLKPLTAKNGSENSVAQGLSQNLSDNHESESYEDLQPSEFSPLFKSSLEHSKRASLLNLNHDEKVQDIHEPERKILQILTDFKRKILSKYKPQNKELYSMNAEDFFVPSFLRAIKENTEESIRSVISEPSRGIYVFEMLHPRICGLFLSEVENIERWVVETKSAIIRPNTMNKYGVVLDHFGMYEILEKWMIDFIRPIAKVLFPHVGGSTLDSHHGFIVEYGVHRDTELGLHVDDSEVTLNVCLGRQFTGGEMYFRGMRCDKHVNTGPQMTEVFDYFHLPGSAILHCGRHRHGCRATTSGYRANLIMWCRSSVFREMKKYQTDSSSWCGECQREKEERQGLSVSATKQELMKRLGNVAH